MWVVSGGRLRQAILDKGDGRIQLIKYRTCTIHCVSLAPDSM